MPPDSSGLGRVSPGQVLGSVKRWLSLFTKLISGFLAVSLPLCSLVCGVDLLPATLLLWMQHPQEQGFSQPKLRLPNKRSHWCAIHSVLNLHKESLSQNSHCAFENVFFAGFHGDSQLAALWSLSSLNYTLASPGSLQSCLHKNISLWITWLPLWSKLPCRSFYQEEGKCC